MICREECNSFGYRDSSNELFAYGLLPLASKFNHSCVPNISKRSQGRIHIFQATTPIEKGSECLISYAPLDATVKERQKHLEGFLFQCSCERCVAEELENRAVIE